MDKTLTMASLEAYSQLLTNQDSVLLVFANEPVPAVYREFIAEEETIALSWLFSSDTKAGIKVTVSDEAMPATEAPISYAQLMNAISKKQPLEGMLEGYYWKVH